jgi:single-stranded-DNA-specific exonuclease
MFYVLLALRARLREAGAFTMQDQPDLGGLLDLVAVGTGADLVRLDHGNRILIEAGLRRLRSARGNPGLMALLEVSGRDPASVQSADLGFVLGPRINAAGRLEDMRIGIHCLLTDDANAARELAQILDGINRERRDLQADMQADALHMLDAAGDLGENEAVICLHHETWHPGVVGLLASRLRERGNRPAFAFAPGSEDGLLRGSGRSVPGVHLRDLLARVDARAPGLITRFGGHAMAAGLSIEPQNYVPFKNVLGDVAAQSIDPATRNEIAFTDGDLVLAEIDEGSRPSTRPARGGRVLKSLASKVLWKWCGPV